jgi:flagellar assembly protein FliH
MTERSAESHGGGIQDGFQDLFSAPSRVRSGKERDPGDRVGQMELDGLAQSLWLKSLEDKAREEGYRAGYRDGFSKGQEDAAEIRTTLSEWSLLLPRLLGEELENQMDHLSDVVLTALTRLLGDALSRPEGVRSLVESLISKWAQTQEADLFFSPEMYAWLESHLPDWFGELEDRKIRPAATAELSGVEIRLSVRDHAVKFDLSSALADIETRLKEALAS